MPTSCKTSTIIHSFCTTHLELRRLFSFSDLIDSNRRDYLAQFEPRTLRRLRFLTVKSKVVAAEPIALDLFTVYEPEPVVEEEALSEFILDFSMNERPITRWVHTTLMELMIPPYFLVTCRNQPIELHVEIPADKEQWTELAPGAFIPPSVKVASVWKR